MTNHILFWAHRKDIESYYSEISTLIPASEVVSRGAVKRTWRLHFPGWRKLWDTICYENRSAHANNKYFNWRFVLKPVETSFLTIQLYSNYFEFLKSKKFSILVVWGAYRLKQSLIIHAAKNLGLQIIYIENGFFPNTTCVDPKGVNASCSLSRNPNFYLGANIPHDLSSLPTSIAPRASVKGRTYRDNIEELPDKYVFIPFQSNGDSVIIKNSLWIKNMWQFFDVLIRVAKVYEGQGITFVVKEHPSCHIDYSEMHAYLRSNPNLNIVFKNDVLTETLIKHAQAILTINSFVGFEALLFSKPVIALGDEAYCIEGLVKSCSNLQSVSQAINNILVNRWQPDSELRQQFLLYVYNDYLVKGSENCVDALHISSMALKIKGLVKVEL